MFKISTILLTLLSVGWNRNTSVIRIASLNHCFSDTVKLHYVDSIQNVWPQFVGKFQPADGVRFQNPDSTDYEGLDIDADLSKLDKIPNATKGFKIYSYPNINMPTNYANASALWHYPVYVVNETKKNRYFTLKDSYVLALQEALHPDGNWYPIERRGPDGCWNGSWSIKVKPKEFLVFLMNRYDGDFKTKIRVRLKVGRSIYYSEPFDGAIAMEQFFVKSESLKKAFVSNKDFMANFWFHGSMPLQAYTK